VKLLLDECLDRRLARDIVGHDVSTVQQMAWAGIQNGDLLRRAAAAAFDAFITADRNLSFQQNLAELPLAVVVLKAPSNRLADLKPLVPKLLAALTELQRNSVVWVGE
jgi:predicted nuclease of predicted toxin-antitoxin system